MEPLKLASISRPTFATSAKQPNNLFPNKGNDWFQSFVIGHADLCNNASLEKWFQWKADPEQSNSQNSPISSQPLLLVLQEHESHTCPSKSPVRKLFILVHRVEAELESHDSQELDNGH